MKPHINLEINKIQIALQNKNRNLESLNIL